MTFFSRVSPLNALVFCLLTLSSWPCQAGQANAPISEPQANPWSGNIETQLGYESNVNQVNRNVENITSSWFSENSLEITRSATIGRGSCEFTLQAEYKTFFATSALDEFLLQPSVILHEDVADGLSLDVTCDAGIFRAKVDQAFVNDPNTTERGVGAGAGVELKKTYPDQTILKWAGRIEGELFEYYQGSNLDCSTHIEAEKILGKGITARSGATAEWQGYRNVSWSGQPADEPPEVNTLNCRAFMGLAGSWNESWKWTISLVGGPDFDLAGGYYNALTLGLRSKLVYQVGNWTFSLRIDPEMAFFHTRPAVLGESSPPLAVQEMWARAEVAYEIAPGWELFASTAWDWQWTNGGNAANASLNSFDDLVIRSGLMITF